MEKLSLTDFCTRCHVEAHYIIEMVEMGILEPEGETTSSWQFSFYEMFRFKKARRLQNDLNLNLAGVALSLQLLDELKVLRNHLRNVEHELKLAAQTLK
jgi:chaperone modulatory protein CbpM